MNRYFCKPRFWGAAALALTLAVCVAPLVGTSQPPAGDAPVRIKVLLPAEATLTVDGAPTKQTGAERDFISPPLPAGRKFSYTFEATWTEDGKARSVKKRLPVEAGRDYTIDFFKEAKIGKADGDKKEKDDKAKDDKKDADKKDTDKKDTDKKDADKKDDFKDDKKDAKKDSFEKKDEVKKEKGEPEARGPKTREIDFTYAATVTGLKPGQKARIWLPVAPSNPYQTVKVVSRAVPGKTQINKEPKFGNEILYTEAQADPEGKIRLTIDYRVTRKEVLNSHHTPPVTTAERAEFLKPDKLVPVGGKPEQVLLAGKELPESGLELGKSLYDIVNLHMVYSKKGTGWGEGDAVWACDSKYGNCSDFHSLFISLARTKKMPAKFEMGFPIPEARGKGAIGGYHCWAWFSPDSKKWVPVDISEANRARDTNPKMVDYYFGNLTENRVMFTTGRDINLVPRQDGPAVNYLVCPYVEVDGRPLPKKNIEGAFRFADV